MAWRLTPRDDRFYDMFAKAAENLVTAGYGKTQLKNSGNPFADENRRVQVVNMRPPFRP